MSHDEKLLLSFHREKGMSGGALAISNQFYVLALMIHASTAVNPDKEICLQKLLEVRNLALAVEEKG